MKSHWLAGLRLILIGGALSAVPVRGDLIRVEAEADGVLDVAASAGLNCVVRDVDVAAIRAQATAKGATVDWPVAASGGKAVASGWAEDGWFQFQVPVPTANTYDLWVRWSTWKLLLGGKPVHGYREDQRAAPFQLSTDGSVWSDQVVGRNAQGWQWVKLGRVTVDGTTPVRVRVRDTYSGGGGDNVLIDSFILSTDPSFTPENEEAEADPVHDEGTLPASVPLPAPAVASPVLTPPAKAPFKVAVLTGDARLHPETGALLDWCAAHPELIRAYAVHAHALAAGQVDFAAFDAVWLHLWSNMTPNSWLDESFIARLKAYIADGGGVLLTLNASAMLPVLGLESAPPSNVYGTQRGYLQGFIVDDAAHALWQGLTPTKQHANWFYTSGIDGTTIYNMLSQTIPVGDVVHGRIMATTIITSERAWPYENMARVVAWEKEEGHVLWVGGGVQFREPEASRYKQNLQTFIGNALNFIAGEGDESKFAALPEQVEAPLPEIPVSPVRVNDDVLVWTASGQERVARDVVYLPEGAASGQGLTVSAARGETEIGQIVLSARRQGDWDVDVALDPVTGPEGAMPVLEVRKISFVEPVGIADPLMPAANLKLKRADRYGANLPLLVNVSIPRDAAPGEYATAVRLTVGETEMSVPVHITVWDYEIPLQSHFRTSLFALKHQPSRMPAQFTPEYETWARDLFGYLADRRISHDSPLPYVWRDFTNARREAGKPEIDVTSPEWQEKFIEWSNFWKDRGLHVNNIAPYGLETDGERFNNFFKTYRQMLEENGWLDEAFTRTVPDEFDARDVAGVRQLIAYARAVRRVAPDVRLSSTAMKPDQLELQMMAAAGTDIWMIHERNLLHSEETMRFFMGEKDLGKKLWLYIHQEQTLGTDPMSVRWWFPRMDAYGVDGCVLWSMTWWHRSGAKWNGENVSINILEETEGCLFWPGPDGVLPSLRLEHLRDGLEDYERIRLLEQVATSNDDAQAASARELIAAWHAAGRDHRLGGNHEALTQLLARTAEVLNGFTPRTATP